MKCRTSWALALIAVFLSQPSTDSRELGEAPLPVEVRPVAEAPATNDVGAQVVSVPIDVALDEAGRTLWLFISSLVAVFFIAYVVVNIMLSRTVR